MIIQFREAQRKDFEEFNKLFTSMNYSGDTIFPHKALLKNEFYNYVDAESIILIKKGEDDFFGYAIVIAYEDKICKIREMYVKQQGKGYGKKLLTFIEKISKEIGMEQIELQSANMQTDRIWEKLGFKSVTGGETYTKKLL